MTTARVAVTGLGLVCSQGQSPQAVFDAWCQGYSGVAHYQTGEAPHSLSVAAAICTDFDAAAALGRARLATMDRVSQLAAVAAQSAWNDAQLQDLPDAQREAVPVLWGTGAGGTQTTERGYRDVFLKGKTRVSPLSVVLSMNNASASHIALLLRLGGECLTYSVACASSAVAVGEALGRIRSGQCQVALAGGVEAALPFGALKAWDSMQILAPAGASPRSSCRPFDLARKGLVLGEGAAALVLEDWDHAQARGARIYAELAGYGASCDHHHLTAPYVPGQLRALRQALRHAGAEAQEVGYINAHGTATAEGDPVEIAALRELLGPHAADTLISSTKSMHGHLLGGAGAIEAVATVLALHEQRVPPTANLLDVDPTCAGLDHVQGAARTGLALRYALSNSFAFGGSNAVLVFAAANQ